MNKWQQIIYKWHAYFSMWANVDVCVNDLMMTMMVHSTVFLNTIHVHVLLKPNIATNP